MSIRKPLSLRNAINAHCRACSFDSAEPGTWRAQITLCPILGCELYEVRPTTDKIPESVLEYYRKHPQGVPSEWSEGRFSEQTPAVNTKTRGAA